MIQSIPLEVAVTTSRPDLVIIRDSQLHMLELTICGNTFDALAAAHTRKAHNQEYLHLLADTRRNGWVAKYTTIEIGALGHHNPVTPAELATNCESILPPKWREILIRAATVAINCSQAIFLARNNRVWSSSRPLLSLH